MLINFVAAFVVITPFVEDYSWMLIVEVENYHFVEKNYYQVNVYSMVHAIKD